MLQPYAIRKLVAVVKRQDPGDACKREAEAEPQELGSTHQRFVINFRELFRELPVYICSGLIGGALPRVS